MDTDWLPAWFSILKLSNSLQLSHTPAPTPPDLSFLTRSSFRTHSTGSRRFLTNQNLLNMLTSTALSLSTLELVTSSSQDACCRRRVGVWGVVGSRLSSTAFLRRFSLSGRIFQPSISVIIEDVKWKAVGLTHRPWPLLSHFLGSNSRPFCWLFSLYRLAAAGLLVLEHTFFGC